MRLRIPSSAKKEAVVKDLGVHVLDLVFLDEASNSWATVEGSNSGRADS